MTTTRALVLAAVAWAGVLAPRAAAFDFESLPSSGYRGVGVGSDAVAGRPSGMQFNMRRPADDAFKFSTDRRPFQAASGSDSGRGSGSSDGSDVGTPTETDKSCHWQGYVLRHQSAKYFVGRVSRRGSVFGECTDGVLRCYEDSGLADAQAAQHTPIACERRTILDHQRSLDLEDAAATGASASASASGNRRAAS